MTKRLKDPQPLTLTVVIPCYNEVSTVEQVLDDVRAVGLANEIIIVDDGSTDGTRDVLQRIEEKGFPEVRIIYHSHNQGKGAAVITGFKAATSDVLLIQDADLNMTRASTPSCSSRSKRASPPSCTARGFWAARARQ